MNIPEILFEDINLLVFNKPSGLLSIRDNKHPKEKSAIDAAMEHLDGAQVFPVHRIDKDTSGVLIVAKNRETQTKMTDIIMEQKMRKLYLAIVKGEVIKEGQVTLPILKGSSGKVKISSAGKKSLTLYRIRKKFKGYTLLEVEPKTGRTHQIRIHMASIARPLAYDHVYGDRKALTLERKGKAPFVFDRLTLHASDAMFMYWKTHRSLHLRAPFPEDLKGVISVLEENYSIEKKHL
jgi:23S rRNA pseudouridine1911/1915/1917 synthase